MAKPNLNPDPAGVALASKRRRTSHLCARCGRPFDGIVTARFCSATCRSLARYQRERAERVTDAPAD